MNDDMFEAPTRDACARRGDLDKDERKSKIPRKQKRFRKVRLSIKSMSLSQDAAMYVDEGEQDAKFVLCGKKK
jgi:hypothetical protein